MIFVPRPRKVGDGWLYRTTTVAGANERPIASSEACMLVTRLGSAPRRHRVVFRSVRSEGQGGGVLERFVRVDIPYTVTWPWPCQQVVDDFHVDAPAPVDPVERVHVANLAIEPFDPTDIVGSRPLQVDEPIHEELDGFRPILAGRDHGRLTGMSLIVTPLGDDRASFVVSGHVPQDGARRELELRWTTSDGRLDQLEKTDWTAAADGKITPRWYLRWAWEEAPSTDEEM